jgi:hypothetical protein
VLQQGGLSPAIGCFFEALLIVKALTLQKQIFSMISRNLEMLSRNNATGIIRHVPHTAIAFNVHQLVYKQSA